MRNYQITSGHKRSRSGNQGRGREQVAYADSERLSESSTKPDENLQVEESAMNLQTRGKTPIY